MTLTSKSHSASNANNASSASSSLARQGSPDPGRTHAGILARFAQVAVVFLLQAAILFLGSGRFNWGWAWVFLGIYLVATLVNGLILMRTNPETVAERGRMQGTKDWDKPVSGLWGLFQYLLLPLIAALDIRFGWSQKFGTSTHIIGAAAFAMGLALFGWAMITNTFFSTGVRIQSDRGHVVCRTGPYRLVRHPGYLGAVIQSIAMPVLFGSWWALIPSVVAAALMIIRTSLEDRMLQNELPGYSDFVRDVRYRLIPGIW